MLYLYFHNVLVGAMTSIKSIRTIKNLKNKIVLLRADLNVPIYNGKILDCTRIHAIKKTVQYLQQHGAVILIMSHLGRPKDKNDQSLSLQQLVQPLSEIIATKVRFCNDLTGFDRRQSQPQEVILLENLRYHQEEESNDSNFAQFLSSVADIYVNDAFAVSHRQHASVAAITKFLPSYAGLLLETEIANLSNILNDSKVTAIIGGGKVSTKLALMQHLLPRINKLIVGGGIANTFLKAQGFTIGQSLFEPSMIEVAQAIIKKHDNLIKPIDVITKDGLTKDIGDLQSSDVILDIGPKTIGDFSRIIDHSSTVIWNGPLGLIEQSPFDQGSVNLAQHIAMLTVQKSVKSIAGGGETLIVINKAKVHDKFTYLSTGGGAFIAFIQNPNLPGIVPLLDTDKV